MAANIVEDDNLFLWINYSCAVETASLGITWAGSRRFDIAVLNINILYKNKHEYKWDFQEDDIQLFRTLCGRRELDRFDTALGLIPEYAILDM